MHFATYIAVARHSAFSNAFDLLAGNEIARMSPPERLELIARLWDSLDQDHLPLSQAQQAELERRLASLDQYRPQGVPWSALKAELEQRCPWCLMLFSLRLHAQN